MESMDVIGLGASTLDILTLVDHFPRGEEVQPAEELVIQGGGPVATAMVTLARLGARVGMMDAIGDDWRGILIRDEFQREGVDTRHMDVIPDSISSSASILVLKSDGTRAILYKLGSAPEVVLTSAHRSAIESAKYLHVNGRYWEACMQAVKWARAAGVQVSFDGGADRYKPAMKELVPLTDICIAARDFAEKYTGELDLAKAAEMIEKNGPRLVVITDGKNGSWVHARGEAAFHQKAYLFPQTIDTTGCGDSYHGAFLFGLLNGMELEQTASLASAVAALNSQRLGGRSGIPTFKEAEVFLLNRGA